MCECVSELFTGDICFVLLSLSLFVCVYISFKYVSYFRVNEQTCLPDTILFIPVMFLYYYYYFKKFVGLWQECEFSPESNLPQK